MGPRGVVVASLRVRGPSVPGAASTGVGRAGGIHIVEGNTAVVDVLIASNGAAIGGGLGAILATNSRNRLWSLPMGAAVGGILGGVMSGC